MTLQDASVQASPYVKQNCKCLRVGFLERNKIYDKAAQHSFFEDFLSRRFAKEMRNGRRRISFAQTLRKIKVGMEDVSADLREKVLGSTLGRQKPKRAQEALSGLV